MRLTTIAFFLLSLVSPLFRCFASLEIAKPRNIPLWVKQTYHLKKTILALTPTAETFFLSLR